MTNCPSGGYVVNATYLVTEDPTDRAARGAPIVGCNQLRCLRCGALVRSAPGVGREGKQTPIEQIYDAPDLATAPGVGPTLAEYRLYLCRCTAFLEEGWRRLEETDPDVKDLVNLPWRCAGHPSVTLPHVFDGVPVASEAELPELVARLAGGWFPEGVPKEFRKAARWLLRLYFWFDEGSSPREAIARAGVALLDDADAKKRAYGLSFLDVAQTSAGKLKVMELLEGDRSGFAGVKDEVTDAFGGRTLEDSLWSVIHGTIGRVERARQLARKEALTPGKGSRALYDPLAQVDADWLIENAGAIVRANPQAADKLLEAAEYNLPNLAAYNKLVASMKGTASA